MIDSHCHLDHVEGEVDEIVAAAREAGVEAIVDIGMGTASSEAAAERAAHYPGVVYASVGIHPNDLAEFEADPDATMAALADLAGRPGVVGVGETGLDRYRDRSDPALQETAFLAHIELAERVDRTLVIHCRDAHGQVLEILDAHGAPERVVMHCFSGDAAFAAECAGRGYYCSFAGNLTFKRNDELRAAAAAVPDELVLVETDAPYLAPEPRRGRPNSPALIAHTVEALATVWATDRDAIVARLRDNTERAFRL